MVSIHASVKDATLIGFRPLAALRSFNPRICKRCDSRKDEILNNPSLVSIHASVKDATRTELLGGTNSVFQSTHL